jgi:hypothetical protein
VNLPDRSRRYWLTLGLGLFLGSLAILIAFDLIHVGDELLDDRMPPFVYVVLFVTFWTGILVLLAQAIQYGCQLLGGRSSPQPDP